MSGTHESVFSFFIVAEVERKGGPDMWTPLFRYMSNALLAYKSGLSPVWTHETRNHVWGAEYITWTSVEQDGTT